MYQLYPTVIQTGLSFSPATIQSPLFILLSTWRYSVQCTVYSMYTVHCTLYYAEYSAQLNSTPWHTTPIGWRRPKYQRRKSHRKWPSLSNLLPSHSPFFPSSPTGTSFSPSLHFTSSLLVFVPESRFSLVQAGQFHPSCGGHGAIRGTRESTYFSWWRRIHVRSTVKCVYRKCLEMAVFRMAYGHTGLP